ncbi:hypothetical protein BUALT_Bualt15G0087800 [Buddleja alternifolia]|uniref:Serine aminopeptidase S33 domain-containing protein n=1 Tax=Buddleja alternifolia TaxID=168488 RepID=A0AAV6WKA3_9LAMI|nr:hypothetical protein BUALT_Bualt15G0087800 [Buddleja alternifolia]
MDYLSRMECPAAESPYELLLRAALLTPISHYLLGISLIFIVFMYYFLEIHFFQDLITGFRGQPVTLTFNPSSQLFTTSDGGTIGLDWVINEDVKKREVEVNDAVQIDDRTPIIIIIPGLASASDSAYVKHLAFKMGKRGWNVVVSNHRGLGGVPITSDCFYNAASTEDIRSVIDHIHRQYPETPLFAVGTSIGANILVKYLGEDGINVPIIGAAAICSPWDSLVCDRFLRRRLVQRLYNKALTAGLKDYAKLHEAVFSRLINWEGVQKARYCRDFDDAVTRALANCETVDAYYRKCTSCKYVGSVTIPLLCISSLDDPICTSEAIPWDECRLNKNVVLATTQHGGHLPFFEGLTAKSIWWVRAVDEFFTTLKSSPTTHQKQEVQKPVSSTNPQETSTDQVPFEKVSEDGMVSALNHHKAEDVIHTGSSVEEKDDVKIDTKRSQDSTRSSKHDMNDIVGPVKKWLNQISHQNRK